MRHLFAVGAAAIALLAAPMAVAQVAVPNPNLARLLAVNSVGGNSSLASLTTSIATVCPRMVNAFGGVTGVPGSQNLVNAPNAAVNDLYQRCNGALNVSAADAAGVLGAIAPEEMVAQDAVISGAAAPQTQALAARVAALGGSGPAARRAASLGPNFGLMDGVGASGMAADGSRVGKFDGFVNGSYGWGEKDASGVEAGFDVDGWSLIGGLDYGLTDRLAAGAALGYSTTEVEFAGTGGNTMESKAWTLAGYGALEGQGGLYGSGIIAYSWITYDSDRRILYRDGFRRDAAGNLLTIDRTARGETDASQIEASGKLGMSFASGPVEYGPSFAVAYRRLEIDGFAESGAQGLDLSFSDQETESLQFQLGGDIGRSFATEMGVVKPYARATVLYEALDDRRNIDVNYRVDPFIGTANATPVIRVATNSPDRTRFLLGGGALFDFDNGFTAFADFEALVGQDDVNSYGLVLGVQRAF
jgi:uncharacterized protein with beta-barrel porin domain